MSRARHALLLALSASLGACGQKGALIMPDAPRSAVPAATSSPVPAAAPDATPASAGSEPAQDKKDGNTARR